MIREILREVLEDYRALWFALRHPTRPADRRMFRPLLAILLVVCLHLLYLLLSP